MPKLKIEIEDLKYKIRILEEENAMLSERAEDTMLLGLVSESIYKLSDFDDVLDQITERISILKNIPFVSCAQRNKAEIEPLCTYSTFSNQKHIGYPITLSDNIIEDLAEGPYLSKETTGLSVNFSDTSFVPRAFVIMPFSCRAMQDGIFVFMTEETDTSRLSSMLFLLDQVIGVAINKLDNQELIKETQLLTRSLEVRVKDRTQALVIANEQLMDEIRERRQSEAALKNAHYRFNTLVSSIDAHVYVSDPVSHEILFMNRKMREIYGENLEGEKCYQVFRQQNTPCSFCKTDELFKNQDKLEYSTIWESYHPISGAYYLNRDRLIRWDDNRLVKLQIASDITQIKTAEKEKEELNRHLQESQKMQAIGTLAGGIAHDFNNLLMGILGVTSLMIDETNRDHPHQENFRSIEEYVKSATNLTKQLMGFAREGKYEPVITDINSIVSASIELFGRTKKEISISASLNKDLWPARVDRGQIHQVLLNIYVNAGQAMPEGGELILETCNRHISIIESEKLQVKKGKYIKISITDTGLGIEDDVIPHIFDPFFTTKQRERGTGLGLASSYGIIRNHSGCIEVKSKKGEGATFTISIPASEGQVADSLEPALNIKKGSGSILLIDDEPMIQNVGRRMLEKLGYQVIVAVGGAEGLVSYRDNSVDIVILDMIMPGMSGPEVYRELQKINPNVNIILASGYSMESQAEELMNMGCAGYLQKPFTLAELSQAISSIQLPIIKS